MNSCVCVCAYFYGSSTLICVSVYCQTLLLNNIVYNHCDDVVQRCVLCVMYTLQHLLVCGGGRPDIKTHMQNIHGYFQCTILLSGRAPR